MAFQCSHLASATSLLAYSRQKWASRVSSSRTAWIFIERVSRENSLLRVISIMEARSNLQDFSQFLREKFLDSLWNGKIKESGWTSLGLREIFNREISKNILIDSENNFSSPFFFVSWPRSGSNLENLENDCRIKLKLVRLRIQISEDKSRNARILRECKSFAK